MQVTDINPLTLPSLPLEKSRKPFAYKTIQDAKFSGTTGYKLVSDPTYIPSVKVLEVICKTIQSSTRVINRVGSK